MGENDSIEEKKESLSTTKEQMVHKPEELVEDGERIARNKNRPNNNEREQELSDTGSMDGPKKHKEFVSRQRIDTDGLKREKVDYINSESRFYEKNPNQNANSMYQMQRDINSKEFKDYQIKDHKPAMREFHRLDQYPRDGQPNPYSRERLDIPRERVPDGHIREKQEHHLRGRQPEQFLRERGHEGYPRERIHENYMRERVPEGYIRERQQSDHFSRERADHYQKQPEGYVRDKPENYSRQPEYFRERHDLPEGRRFAHKEHPSFYEGPVYDNRSDLDHSKEQRYHQQLPLGKRGPPKHLEERSNIHKFVPPMPTSQPFVSYKKPSEDFDLSDAMVFLNKIREIYKNSPGIYDSFLEIMRDYKTGKIEAPFVVKSVSSLFKSNPDLIETFNMFLPQEFKIRFNRHPIIKEPVLLTPRPPEVVEEKRKENMASAYISKVKARLSTSKNRYRDFIDTLQTYKKSEKGVEFVYEQLRKILYGHDDLIEEFKMFVPDPMDNSLSHTKKPTIRPQGQMEKENALNEIKKDLEAKNSYREFCKALNLFNQNLLNANDFLFLVSPLINNEKSINGLKKYINYEDVDVRDVSFIKNFKGLKKIGSYRILNEKLDVFEGRNILNTEILNDICVSCPTHQSEEDSFFIDKKTIAEETMFRIEDERYEAEIHLNRINDLIVSLETISGHLEKNKEYELYVGDLNMSAELVEEILELIYHEKSCEIFEELLAKPESSIPVILKRLYKLSRVWREQIREKEDVWRDAITKNYYKALDKEGANFKNSEKKISLYKGDLQTNKILFSDQEIVDFLFLVLKSATEKHSEDEEALETLEGLKSFLSSFSGSIEVNLSLVSFISYLSLLHGRMLKIKNCCGFPFNFNEVASDFGISKPFEGMDRYEFVKKSILKLVKENIDQAEFEEEIRVATYSQGYEIFTFMRYIEKMEVFIFDIMHKQILKKISSKEKIEDPEFSLEKISSNNQEYKIVKINKHTVHAESESTADSSSDSTKESDTPFLLRTLNRKNICTSTFSMEYKICFNTLKLKYTPEKSDIVLKLGKSRNNTKSLDE